MATCVAIFTAGMGYFAHLLQSRALPRYTSLVIDMRAQYYGHSEAEFGMSWCAGFSGSFYRGYNDLIPPAPGAIS